MVFIEDAVQLCCRVGSGACRCCGCCRCVVGVEVSIQTARHVREIAGSWYLGADILCDRAVGKRGDLRLSPSYRANTEEGRVRGEKEGATVTTGGGLRGVSVG
jgi:hypothetical protein